jgi:hypothetical protein
MDTVVIEVAIAKLSPKPGDVVFIMSDRGDLPPDDVVKELRRVLQAHCPGVLFMFAPKGLEFNVVSSEGEEGA